MPHYIDGPSNRGQLWLFERSLDEMLPRDAAIRKLSFVMDHLNWRPLEASYPATGRPAYCPTTMAKALIFAYSLGIFSSRRIEELFKVDVRFMWLANGATPDHTSISRFRKDKGQLLSELFVQSVRMCSRVGLVLLDVVSIDGTKLPANASVKSVWDEKKLERAKAAVAKLLAAAEAEDQAEDGAASCEGPTLEQLKERQLELDEIAKSLSETPGDKIVVTDPDSKMMMTRGGNRPGYNLQLGVDAKTHVIVACRVTQGQNDHGLLPGVVEQAKDNCGLIPATVLADKGYDDAATLTYLAEEEQDGLIALVDTAAEKNRDPAFRKERFLYDENRDVYICPEGNELRPTGISTTDGHPYRHYAAQGCRACPHYDACAARRSTKPDKRKIARAHNKRFSISEVDHLRMKMRRRLVTEEGRERYKLRAVTSEPVFGNVKHNMGFLRFGLRGCSGVQVEGSIMAAAHNLWKVVAALPAHAAACLWTHHIPASQNG